jgi:iron complex outermembrane receptor protein
VSVGAGSHETRGTVRYGGTLGDGGHFRIYARSIDQDNFRRLGGASAFDQYDLRRAGFRADWGANGGNTFTLQGDVYEGDSDHIGSLISLVPPANVPTDYTIDLKGGNLLGRWKRALSATSEWALQFYYDYYERRYLNVGERRDTYDLDFQHRFLWGDAHDIVWGGGYRLTRDRMDNTFVVAFDPAQREDNVVNLFAQDEIALKKDKLYLTVGSKFEHNHYTGFEYQPNLRLRWKIDERQTAWGAISRAVHTPSRTDVNGIVTSTATPGAGGIANVMRLQSNPSLRSEHVLAYEAGYRVRPNERVQADVSVFYNEHYNLMTIEPAASYMVAGTPGYRVLPRVFYNKAEATTHGLELSGNWRPSDKWQVRMAYTRLKMDISRDADSVDSSIENEVGRSPQNQFQFHLLHFPSADVDLSAALYYVDSLPSLGVQAYTRFDARIGWRVRRGLEFSLTGRNLFDPGHTEFINPSDPRSSEEPRSIFGAATWRF